MKDTVHAGDRFGQGSVVEQDAFDKFDMCFDRLDQIGRSMMLRGGLSVLAISMGLYATHNVLWGCAGPINPAPPVTSMVRVINQSATRPLGVIQHHFLGESL